MDDVLLVMLKLDGTWMSDYTFSSLDTFGIRIGLHSSYTSLLDMLRGILNQYKPNHSFRISYMVDGCPPPVFIVDDETLKFYLYMKCLQSDVAKLPLCVE
ncbi:unnamed protein product, partial [Cuscuta epithymum]